MFTIYRIPPPTNENGPPYRFEVSECVIDSQRCAFTASQKLEPLKLQQGLSHGETKALLPRLMAWQGTSNLYPEKAMLGVATNSQPAVVIEPRITLPEWRQLWHATEIGSVCGQPRFQGGDLLAKAKGGMDMLTPAGYRLLPGSPGKAAGADGHDLGADVDLVGPGEAYKRWKQTPEYQQWLNDIKSAK